MDSIHGFSDSETGTLQLNNSDKRLFSLTDQSFSVLKSLYKSLYKFLHCTCFSTYVFGFFFGPFRASLFVTSQTPFPTHVLKETQPSSLFLYINQYSALIN